MTSLPKLICNDHFGRKVNLFEGQGSFNSASKMQRITRTVLSDSGSDSVHQKRPHSVDSRITQHYPFAALFAEKFTFEKPKRPAFDQEQMILKVLACRGFQTFNAPLEQKTAMTNQKNHVQAMLNSVRGQQPGTVHSEVVALSHVGAGTGATPHEMRPNKVAPNEQ